MNIFERLYNKVFHNEALTTEDKLEGKMFSELENLSKSSKFSTFQKAKEMVDCVEEYLGKIVKNRGNLWTGRNKVSKFLSNIQNKGSIEDKVSYLAEITKDKEFGGSYWAQKIGPIFASISESDLKNVNEKEAPVYKMLEEIAGERLGENDFRRSGRMLFKFRSFLADVYMKTYNNWKNNKKKYSKDFKNVCRLVEFLDCKGKICEKIAYLSNIDKDKSFSKFYWARKIGPIFSSIKQENLREDLSVYTIFKEKKVAGVMKYLKYYGAISDDYEPYSSSDDVKDVVDLWCKIYHLFNMKDDYVVGARRLIDTISLATICDELGLKDYTFGKVIGTGVISEFKADWDNWTNETFRKICKDVNYFMGKEKEICKEIYGLDVEKLKLHNNDCLTGFYFEFYVSNDAKRREIIEECWEYCEETERDLCDVTK